MGGHCNKQSFKFYDFLSYLVLMGGHVYEMALANPDGLSKVLTKKIKGKYLYYGSDNDSALFRLPLRGELVSELCRDDCDLYSFESWKARCSSWHDFSIEELEVCYPKLWKKHNKDYGRPSQIEEAFGVQSREILIEGFGVLSIGDVVYRSSMSGECDRFYVEDINSFGVNSFDIVLRRVMDFQSVYFYFPGQKVLLSKEK